MQSSKARSLIWLTISYFPLIEILILLNLFNTIF